jgi:hypothetical protein
MRVLTLRNIKYKISCKTSNVKHQIESMRTLKYFADMGEEGGE